MHLFITYYLLFLSCVSPAVDKVTVLTFLSNLADEGSRGTENFELNFGLFCTLQVN